MSQKQVLVVSYSQTGQLDRVVDCFCRPLRESQHVAFAHLKLKPQKPFPFPWPFFKFFDTFPESVYTDPIALEPFDIPIDRDYDLVILAYQPWFLSPSLPMSSFLQSPLAGKLLKDKPVITLVGCRNMWVMAQEEMKKLIHSAGGHLIDNVVLIDQSRSLESFITTPRWLLTGKKHGFMGLRDAGIHKEEIRAASRFGCALVDALKADREKEGSPLLEGLGACRVDTRLVRSEKIAKRSFRIWGALLRKAGAPGSFQRKIILLFYVTFLVTLIITVVPLSMLLHQMLKPLGRKKAARQKAELEQPSGSDTSRMTESQIENCMKEYA